MRNHFFFVSEIGVPRGPPGGPEFYEDCKLFQWFFKVGAPESTPKPPRRVPNPPPGWPAAFQMACWYENAMRKL